MSSATKETNSMKETNIAIIGSGPAGYTAAIYAARARLAPVIFAGYQSGGQLMYTTEVENYPGFAEGIQGPKLMMEMRQQAARFEAEIVDKFVTAVDFSARPFRVWTNLPDGVAMEVFRAARGDELGNYQQLIRQSKPDLVAKSVIISTGAESIMLGVPGEQEFLSRGVSTCAVCDAAFFREKVTYVVGGGDSAMEDAMALAKFAKSVTMVHRRDQFRASKIMQERVLNHEKIKILWNSQIEEVIGNKKVERLRVNVDGKSQELPADGLFVAIGHRPMTKVVAGQVELDGHGYVVTRQSATEAGLKLASQAIDEKGLLLYPTMTSVEGVFAAGDGVDVRYKQAVTAAGQGCSAALDAERWLERQ
jgi:thioredoxin reductase (NADPH)